MKNTSFFLLRCRLLIRDFAYQTGLLILALILVWEVGMRNAIASDIELDFSIPEPLKVVPIPSKVPVAKVLSPPAKNLLPLQVATPYLIDETPPGSYDFTLLRNNLDQVEVPAPCAGLVTYTKFSNQGYGNRLEILCEVSGYSYFMAHFQTIRVKVGQRVQKGETLGVQGSTGNSTGAHIHLEIGTRPFLEFYPESRITNRAVTMPLVREYFDFVAHSRNGEPRLAHIPSLPKAQPHLTSQAALDLEFDIPENSQAKLQVEKSEKVNPDVIPQAWWHGGSNSLIAIALGAAEGTRNLDGKPKPAYYWHLDPGNNRDNFGTFSYQHLQGEELLAVQQVTTPALKRQVSKDLKLPQKADELQLQRLQNYHRQLLSQAETKGIMLNRLEFMNGLDLANQSPQAALSPGGYIDRLIQMKLLVKDTSEQILEARVWSFWDMQQNRWDAPGLGNEYEAIRRDQKRRFQQIQRVLAEQAIQVPSGLTH